MARSSEQPQCLICKTFKGYGLGTAVSDKVGFHGKPFGKEKATVIEELLTKQLTDAPNPSCLKPSVTSSEWERKWPSLIRMGESP